MRDLFGDALGIPRNSDRGDYCILYQTIAFTVAANGNQGGFPVAEMFRFKDGKIVEWRANYFDACLMAKLIKGE